MSDWTALVICGGRQSHTHHTQSGRTACQHAVTGPTLHMAHICVMGAGRAKGSFKIAVLEQLVEGCEEGIKALTLMPVSVVKFKGGPGEDSAASGCNALRC